MSDIVASVAELEKLYGEPAPAAKESNQ